VLALRPLLFLPYDYSMKPIDSENKNSHKGLLGGLALGGVAASPFLGMIGEDPITKDPHKNPNIKRYSGIDLERLANPGDVLVTTQPKWGQGMWKVLEGLSSGTDYYHAEPVFYRDENGRVMSNSAGIFTDPSWKGLTSAERMQQALDPISKDLRHEDFILLRPKQPLTEAQRAAFVERVNLRSREPYSGSTGVKSYLRDMFVPKMRHHLKNTPVNCKDNVCSTLASQSMTEATGKSVHPHKAPNRVLPMDFLRDKSIYDVVGATEKYKSVFKNPGMARLLFRGGVGAGMAGGIYGAYKEPEAIPAVAALGITPTILKRLEIAKMQKAYPKKHIDAVLEKVERRSPTWADRIGQFGHNTMHAKKVRQSFLRRSLPIAAAAGLGTYGLTKGIEHLLRRNATEPASE